MLYTIRYYACGCSACGSGNVPIYCYEHPVDLFPMEVFWPPVGPDKNQVPTAAEESR
jgi:hypothetical protein